jgi:hypothetical protein
MSIFAHVKPKLRLLSTTGLVCAAVAAAIPAHAAARIGWVWADEPTATSAYTPASSYSYNSSTQTGAVTITRQGTGFYQVDFTGLYASSLNEISNVQVTAYDTNGYCTSAGWGAKGAHASAQMWVACYSASGASADNYFTLLYQAHDTNTGTADKGLAFVWDGDASTSYTPSIYSYNSTGGANAITHNGTGSYTVTLPGLTKTGGDVQVTAYNGFDTSSNPARCKVENWYNDTSNTYVNVLCFNSTGTAADEEFSLVFSLADPYAVRTPTTNYQAYEWADKPTHTTVYTASGAYNYSNFGTGKMTSQNVGTGAYEANIPGTLPSYSTSNVLVTGYGSDNSYCNVTDWFPISVACYAQGGTAINEEFDVSYQTWE